jgi:hypothetical protein
MAQLNPPDIPGPPGTAVPGDLAPGQQLISTEGNGTIAGHLVLVSIAVLLGAAFVAQGVADSSPGAHGVVVALLVGVVLILLMRWQGTQTFASLTTYPWNPPGG